MATDSAFDGKASNKHPQLSLKPPDDDAVVGVETALSSAVAVTKNPHLQMEKLKMDRMELGCSPANEECEQLGPNYDSARARLECRQFIEQLRRQFGQEPDGARLVVIENPHDFGVYLEVACKYNEAIEAACSYAFRCESEAWQDWDAAARVALGLPAAVAA